MYSVYHIGINDDLNSGYIGISKNPEVRFTQHKRQKANTNQHLLNAFNKYKDLIKLKILISNIEEEFARLIEEELRPYANIGWNIAKGGGIPPNPIGKVRSKEYCENIAKAKIGAKNPMYGKKVIFSEEHRKKLSESVPLLKCPHCGKEARSNGMKRWHFDRCKNNESK
jgi:predicted GIY-YIG superfamily endonuclease